MSLTNPAVHVPSPSFTDMSWLRRHLTWLLVGLAVVATAVFVTFMVVDDSGTDTAPATDRVTTDIGSVADNGSISAIDHRVETGSTADGVLHESVSAIDHRVETGSSSNGLLHESISAIDHRTAG